jgi:hypothetical protein
MPLLQDSNFHMQKKQKKTYISSHSYHRVLVFWLSVFYRRLLGFWLCVIYRENQHNLKLQTFLHSWTYLEFEIEELQNLSKFINATLTMQVKIKVAPMPIVVLSIHP